MKIGLVPSREYAYLAGQRSSPIQMNVSVFLGVNLSIYYFIDKFAHQDTPTGSLDDPNAIWLLMCCSIC